MTAHNYQRLIEKLDAFIRKYYKNQLLRGLIYSTGLVLLFFTSISIAEYFAYFNSAIRATLFYSFLLSTGFILIKYIAIPLSKLYKLGSLMSHEEAANIIGKHFADVQDKLLNILQLQKQQEQTNTSTNDAHHALINASINQKIDELKPIPFTTAIDLSENKKYVKYTLAPILLIVVILFAAPSIIKDGSKRLIHHNEHFEKESPFQFVITNDELKTVSQQDYQLNVKLTGDEIPNSLFITLNGNEFKLSKKNIVNFNYTFKNVQQNIRFKLSADGYTSKEYELTTLPNPVLLDFDVTLNFPAYLNRKNETIKNIGDLILPAGTKVSWDFRTKNTKQLRISLDELSTIIAPTGENEYTYSATLLSNTKYSISTANEFLKNKDSVSYAINVIPDKYPTIKVEELKDSNTTRNIAFKGEIKDDYGFKKLTFNYRYITKNDSATSRSFKKMTTNSSAITIKKALTQNQFFHYWNMNELNISPGDQIEYYFEVWDNDGIIGSKATRSQKRTFKAPTLDELNKSSELNNEKIKESLAKRIEEAKDVQKELNDLQRKIAEKKTLTWDEKKKLQDLLNKQKQLQEKVEKIKTENKQNNNKQNEYSKQDEKILEKQKQLEDLFEKIMSPEMKMKYEELRKILDELDKEKVRDALDKMKLDNKDLLKELDRNLEVFKQLEFEQKLQKSIEKLDDLAKKQDELSRKTEDKKSDSKQQKEKQEKLNKKFENLKKDLQDLEKKNSALENPNKMEDTKPQQESIQQEMKKSSEQLENKQKNSAAKSQKNAAEQMEQMSEQLSQMQQKMEEEAQGEDINQLRDILENLIQLSFGQEALMKELSGIKTSDPAFYKINRKQIKLKDDSKMIEDSLLTLSKRNPQIESVVNREINAINMNMGKAIDEIKESQSRSYDGKNHKQEALSRQQFTMTSINNLALMLNEVLAQMQADAKKQGKPGSGSCKKPGGKGSKPSAATMRKMQEQLNEQIKKLKESMQKGGNKPGSKPGKSENISKELAQLAAQQEAIRREIQKMAKQLNKNGNGTGEMSKLAEKMEKTETDLVNKMISQETINRQEEILSRLLESEKAEKEREMDNKRQSNETKSENLRNLSQFLEYKELRQKETELMKTVSPSLTPFYKTKVNQYFNTIIENN